MRGYKAFEDDLTCRGFQYEIGKTYKIEGDIGLCERGFHFCREASRCYVFYPKFSRICAVEASGEIIDGGDKSVCSEITILNEIIGVEKSKIVYGNGYGNGYGYGNGGDINKILIFKEG